MMESRWDSLRCAEVGAEMPGGGRGDFIAKRGLLGVVALTMELCFEGFDLTLQVGKFAGVKLSKRRRQAAELSHERIDVMRASFDDRYGVLQIDRVAGNGGCVSD